MVLRLHPSNTDTKFRSRLPQHWRIDYGLVLLFHVRQQNLINYQHHGPAWLSPPYVAPHAHTLVHITFLQLFLKQPEDCECAGVLINRATRVKGLAIEISYDFKRKLTIPRYAPHLRAQRLEAIRALFGSVDANVPRLALESLSIKWFPLGEMAEVLATKLPLQNLKHLQLNQCPKQQELVGRLVQMRVNLVTYRLHACDEQGLESRNESLLELMTSPTKIVITSPKLLLRNWATLSARSHALRTLKIRDEGYDNYSIYLVLHRSMRDFSDFCGATSSLEQLDVTCPAIEAVRWEEPEGFVKMLVSIC